MLKMALLGKASTGKNTVANLVQHHIVIDSNLHGWGCKQLAFADPIKEMVRTMFPFLKKKWLYGPSQFRSEIIEGAVDDKGNPLTVRQALIDVGTRGRKYRDAMWIDVLHHRYQKEVRKKRGIVMVTDVRFRNEFDFLKNQGFFITRLKKHTDSKINNISETNQDSINDSECDFVIDNNFDLVTLTETVIDELIPIFNQ